MSYKKVGAIERECFFCEENKKLSVLKNLEEKSTFIGVCKDCQKEKRLKIK